jgi:hypothetical protein
MADGNNTAGGMGMGMIIGLLIVLIVVVVGGFYLFGGSHSNPVQSAGSAVSGAASGAGHSVSGTLTAK